MMEDDGNLINDLVDQSMARQCRKVSNTTLCMNSGVTAAGLDLDENEFFMPSRLGVRH